jgi:hypothetical protein
MPGPTPIKSDAEPVPASPAIEAPVPQKEEPMSDTTVAPAGQTVVSGNDHDDHSHAGLWAVAGDHRISAQLATEGRIDGLATTFNLKAIADSEARNADRFSQVLTYIKEEGDKTRHCLMQQEIDRLRSDNVKLEFRIK